MIPELYVWYANGAQMMLRQSDGTERDMGGLVKQSLVKTIVPHLQRLVDELNQGTAEA